MAGRADNLITQLALGGCQKVYNGPSERVFLTTLAASPFLEGDQANYDNHRACDSDVKCLFLNLLY